ncbi:MAG: hypothetical protein A2568_03475 [Candidatus Yanofskybacteria bacterium RIFOXYD1_FULL_44_17]|uniref:Glycosyltransferase RgtA/B/C/D-like domain-containing protein n=1 Tax=Candidatus Yanofskybacteria bacterium GW2011_GWE2_40_11 TaxID=1619033 RepID=A0A0G0TS95_9BACT|nr:MAG: hypothetical protein UT69_C0005G0002 [Candidatus Yanofskybacteria bacterium GW2011_GWE1_40_10]KKR40727.1 MAG: hypothetical protein UT75_C0005G0035 [Candidatus Yanofskybacteria bacterium GW2011_GWE2_40_11]OGN36010.1 MAG: hypothetical protein A2207_03055 [Candidatus Yanofskybacteria bacterium RIFOXYA1_FULL_44_17]OGN36388.1 MAG: hypothetical protein A2241_01430 [Candidatus Yanofskybacteria bacterium RIFOXYA2_FULL_45_28]OGN37433.1 MAG: hypothetical protein A2371_00505 [Candidatus Yanofskyba
MDKAIGKLALVCLFVLIGSLMIHGLYSINQDIGRHIKIGQVIWETKSVPDTNLFSFTVPNHPFVNHHWLSELFFYALSSIVSLKWFIIFKAILNLSAFLIVYTAVRKRSSVSAILLPFFLAAMVFVERTDVRPEIFSYLYLALFLYILIKAKYEARYQWLYALPFIQVLWTNYHIYFVLGPIMTLFFLIDRYAHDRENRQILKTSAIVFGLTCLATLINPSFVTGALEPLNIMRDYGYSIVENQSIFFLTDYGISKFTISVFELSIIALAISFFVALKNGARKITFEALTAITFAILGIYMIRNFGPYSLVLATIGSLNFGYVKSEIKERGLTILYTLATIIILLVTLQVINGNFYAFTASGKKFNLEVPTGADNAVNFIKQNNIRGPVFNNFDIGSFMIWKMWPDEKVFVDGRPEAYGVDFFEKIYKPMQESPETWARLSEEYKINYILFAHTDITPWAQTFLNYIITDKKWAMVYIDNNSVIFLKDTIDNKALISKFRK